MSSNNLARRGDCCATLRNLRRIRSLEVAFVLWVSWADTKFAFLRKGIISMSSTSVRNVSMSFRSGTIADVIWKPLKKFHDNRGWLCEMFRHDDLAEEFFPTMAYISMTEPGVARGPHEHVDQA